MRGPSPTAPSAADLGKELEAATRRLVDLLRRLNQATSRDEVIGAMVGHLAETHNRSGFLHVRSGELAVFTMLPQQDLPTTSLALATPSTFQDAVGTRLPYRGPVTDEPSRAFLSRLFGRPPPEILLIPMVVRDRVVGVIYADGRRRHTFDDHFVIAARAAGLALERIVKAKRA